MKNSISNQQGNFFPWWQDFIVLEGDIGRKDIKVQETQPVLKPKCYSVYLAAKVCPLVQN